MCSHGARQNAGVFFHVTLALFILGGLLAGCAGTGPPAKPIAGIQSIVGTWQGHLVFQLDRRGDIKNPSRLVIREDGSYYQTGLRGGLNGTIQITDGRGTFAGSPFSGAVTLHEGEGKRLLRLEGADTRSGRMSAEYTPAD